MSVLAPEAVARLLPDEPRWVEVRGMLLTGMGRPVGAVATSPVTFVALHAGDDQAAVVGRPPHELIQNAAASATELLAVPENADWVTAALPSWQLESATIHVASSLDLIRAVPPGVVRELTIPELSGLPIQYAQLRDDLLVEARSGTPVFAAFAGEQPVAFCYAGSVTERWWDLSVDTLEPYRRQGYAAQCVAHVAQYMAAQGRMPVWGASKSNTASARLAAKLGFTPVDAIVVFWPAEESWDAA
ncbi:MAG: GNAT family N-acetyltransferase [Gemmatimonadales bacterium]|nr:GNAT family N-acetyltransferase [Gemmatimonadales bacterium]